MSVCPSCNAKNDDAAKFCPKCGAALVRTAGSDDDDQVGRIIAGKFRIEALIGEGGMGKVFRATQMSLDKTVVLKVLRSSLLGDARTVARFQREAKAASRLNHPNSISVIDFGQSDDGSLYIAMEYVAGEDLHQLLSREGPLPQKRSCHIVGQVLSALADAHAAGVIHRDLKPENIMVEQRRGEPDFVKVLDFGIAKIQDTNEGGGDGQALTRAGFVCGTPEYMSPEQARGLSLDARSDLYAVGVILFQTSTNMLPFEADSAVALATMHLTTPPPPPREKRPDAPISESMEALILRAMEKDPANRPQSAEEFRNELLTLEREDDAATQIQAVPTARAMRNSGRLRQVHRTGGNGAQPSSSVVVTTPTWSSSPGREERTVGSTRGASLGRSRSSGRATALIFAAALFGTAFLAGGGLFAYDRWLRKTTATTTPEVVRDPPKPVAGDLNLAADPPEADPEKNDRARRAKAEAASFTADGDQALAETDYARAVAAYLRAYENAPTRAAAKRVALSCMLKNDHAAAHKYLGIYLKEAKDEADAPLVRKYLSTAASQ